MWYLPPSSIGAAFILLFFSKTFYIIYFRALKYLYSFLWFQVLQIWGPTVILIFMGDRPFHWKAPFLLFYSECFFSHKNYQHTFSTFHLLFFRLLPNFMTSPWGKIELFFFHSAYSWAWMFRSPLFSFFLPTIRLTSSSPTKFLAPAH